MNSSKHTDQSDGLNAVSHKKGHQKGPNGTKISHRSRDTPWMFWLLYYQLPKYLSLPEKENSSSL